MAITSQNTASSVQTPTPPSPIDSRQQPSVRPTQHSGTTNHILASSTGATTKPSQATAFPVPSSFMFSFNSSDVTTNVTPSSTAPPCVTSATSTICSHDSGPVAQPVVAGEACCASNTPSIDQINDSEFETEIESDMETSQQSSQSLIAGGRGRGRGRTKSHRSTPKGTPRVRAPTKQQKAVRGKPSNIPAPQTPVVREQTQAPPTSQQPPNVTAPPNSNDSHG